MNTPSPFKLISFHLISAALLVGSIFCLSGCKSGPPKPKPISLTLKIQAAGQAASLTIPVYVGAANSQHDKALLDDDVDDILRSLRSNPSIDTLSFQLAIDGKTVIRKDPLWSKWLEQKRDYVVVIADLPKNFGGASKRRVRIPLEKALWRHLSSDKTVHVEIHETGVKLLDIPGL